MTRRTLATMTYPVIPEWAEFTALRDRHQDLQARYKTTADEADRLDRTRDQAQEEDRQAYAQALIDGKGDPGQKATLAHDKQAAAKRRETDALRLAIQRTETEILDLVQAEGRERRETMEAQTAEQRAEAHTHLLALQEQMATIQETQGVTAWLQRALSDYQARPFRDGTVGMGRVTGLKRPNGEDHITSDVLHALAATLDGPTPPKVRKPGEHVALQDQNWGEVHALLPHTGKGTAPNLQAGAR